MTSNRKIQLSAWLAPALLMAVLSAMKPVAVYAATSGERPRQPISINDNWRFHRGPGEIVATDNGDPTDMTSFVSHERRAFNGLALVIVRGVPGRTGPMTLHASAGPLRGATVARTR